MKKKTKLIVALDVDTLDRAKDLVGRLYPQVKIFKVGSQLFTAYGPKAVEMIGKRGAKVFLDLKFHDIPNTVYLAAQSGAGLACEAVPVIVRGQAPEIKDKIARPVFMMTVHIAGDKKMLQSAVKGASERAAELKIRRPFIVGVTLLTSQQNQADTQRLVLDKAKRAKEAGLDGVVCSVFEAARIRKELGSDFLIVTAGIRPQGYLADDQSRVATAKEAVEAGADFIVVGRPILKAEDPLKAAQGIIKDL